MYPDLDVLVNRPVSVRKVQANRRNALKSTGPRTSRGKINSSKNALKHGFFANDLFGDFLGGREDPQEFLDLHARLREDLRPEGALEELEVESIAVCWWRRARAWRYENAEVRWAVMGGYFREGWDGSNPREVMIPCYQSLILKLESAGKEIEANGEISQESMESMFDLEPSFRRLWPQFEATGEKLRQKKDDEDTEKMAREMGIKFTAARALLRDPKSRVEGDRFAAVATTKIAIRYLEVLTVTSCRSMSNVAREREAIPNGEALDRVLRYESANSRDLSRSLDRLERLQRRRKGEFVPPTLGLRLT
jgi:hypothetical protein